MPTISVIIPVYKVERYLDACVASVAGQTYADLEIILVDDGSPDNCPALCDAWAKKDARIKVIHRPNGGLSAARNSGLDIAGGEFIAFVDSDDKLEPQTLERALTAQQNAGADIVLFDYLCTDENDRPLQGQNPVGRPEETLTPPQFWQKYFTSGDACTYYVVAWNKLYKGGLFRTLRYAAGKRYEDMFLLPHLIAQCEKIACLNFRGYRYAQRAGSTRRRSCDVCLRPCRRKGRGALGVLGAHPLLLGGGCAFLGGIHRRLCRLGRVLCGCAFVHGRVHGLLYQRHKLGVYAGVYVLHRT
ncbi:MAG: glycosyltransferase family 2 protein [Subdoligranulum sp.]|nr:glycosyltransferase family 2 protein [Subdoligranulum sp.]